MLFLRWSTKLVSWYIQKQPRQQTDFLFLWYIAKTFMRNDDVSRFSSTNATGSPAWSTPNISPSFNWWWKHFKKDKVVLFQHTNRIKAKGEPMPNYFTAQFMYESHLRFGALPCHYFLTRYREHVSVGIW